jgi:peptide/nickel transport system substrate-binding protein
VDVSDSDPTPGATAEPTGPEVATEILTFLIADVRGYTRFTQEHGDEAAGRLAARFAVIVRDVVEFQRGRLLELRGDEALVVFSSARQAIRAAVDLQVRFVGETTRDPSLPFRVGIGLDAGEAVPVEGGYRGGALNLAARLCSQAGPGEVLATQEVVHLARKIDGIRYTDRAPLQLKGMAQPVRAVIVRPEDSDPVAELTALARSSAPPVRRSYWRRNKTATAAVAIVVLAAVIVPVAMRRGGAGSSSSGLPAIGVDSAGAIDLHGGSIGSQLQLGTRPNQIAAGFDALWVTNSDDGTVAKIDPQKKSVIQRIPVGTDPTGIATGAGAVWVANSDGRSVDRINPGTNTVVKSIPVGNGPIGLAASSRGVWVANSLDDTVARIDPRTDKVVGVVAVPGGTPTALAIGFDSVWVANATDGTVSRIDLSTNRLTSTLRVGNGPRGIAVAKDGVWVSNSLDGTVARLDPATGSVTATRKVGADPGTIVEADGALWVADEFGGAVTRIDPRDLSVRTIVTGSAPAGLAVLGGSLWATTRTAPTTHRGGTLTLVSSRDNGTDIDTIDPSGVGASYPVLTYVYDGLLGYKRVGGVDGSTVVPDLATSIPTPTAGGTVYTFQLRRGLHYSDGTPVLARDVPHGIERMFAVGSTIAQPTLQSVVGAPACVQQPTRCDLSKGIVADDAARTVTFHLSQPDPDFLYQLSGPGPVVVPSSLPPHDVGATPAPGTGPYVIADFERGKRLELARNPHFTPWSAAQPAGYPDRIVWTETPSLKTAKAQEQALQQDIAAVEQGKADALFDEVPKSMLDPITTQYTQLAHFWTYRGPWSMYLNVHVPPFNDVRVRRALAFAVDRNEAAKVYPIGAVPSCQTLVPNFSGYQPYCPYTIEPGDSGAWTAPDLATAQQLVEASGTKGTPVTVWTWDYFKDESKYVGSVLQSLGYPTTVKVIGGTGDAGFGAFWTYVADSRNRAQASGYWDQQNDPWTGGLTNLLTCGQFVPDDPTGMKNQNTAEFCDPAVDHLIAEATAEQSSNPAAATALWTDVDRALVDKAPVIPLVIPQDLDLVSPRVRNYQHSPVWGILLDQLWVQ